jgi:hypothetical protein
MMSQETTAFTITEDHLKLLRRAYVGWQDCEFGAPEIDPKRPYGNSSVLLDIAEILGVELADMGDEECIPLELEEYFHKLHRETQAVLQIALATGEFKAGDYVSDKYKDNWRRMPEYNAEVAE